MTIHTKAPQRTDMEVSKIEEIKAEFLMFVPEDDGSAMDWLENRLEEAHQAGRKEGIDEAVEMLESKRLVYSGMDSWRFGYNSALDDTIKALQDKK